MDFHGTLYPHPLLMRDNSHADPKKAAYFAWLFALSLKNKGEKITVLSFSQDVIKYCADENIDYIKLKYIRPSFYSIKKPFIYYRVTCIY